MSHLNRGLFDPRHQMVHWPEPNDDPNIPYVWGLSGYTRSNGDEDTIVVKNYPAPKIPNETAEMPEPLKVAAGVALTLSILGLYDGYTESAESTVGGKLFDSVTMGLVYATGIGFIVHKLKG